VARRTRTRWLQGEDLDQLVADLDAKVITIQGDAEVIVHRVTQRVGLEMMHGGIARLTGETAGSVTWDAAPTVQGSQVWAETGPEHFVARFLEYGTSKMSPQPFADAAATSQAAPFILDLLNVAGLDQKRRVG
jgi:hypothetical protein